MEKTRKEKGERREWDRTRKERKGDGMRGGKRGEERKGKDQLHLNKKPEGLPLTRKR